MHGDKAANLIDASSAQLGLAALCFPLTQLQSIDSTTDFLCPLGA